MREQSKAGSRARLWLGAMINLGGLAALALQAVRPFT